MIPVSPPLTPLVTKNASSQTPYQYTDVCSASPPPTPPHPPPWISPPRRRPTKEAAQGLRRCVRSRAASNSAVMEQWPPPEGEEDEWERGVLPTLSGKPDGQRMTQMDVEPPRTLRAALLDKLDTLRTSMGPILSQTYTTSPETSVQKGLQLIHGLFNVVGSLVFTVLYIWSTYDQPAFGSWRYGLDAALCMLFALDYCVSLALTEQKWQYALKLPRLLDLLSFLPVLIEVVLHSAAMAASAPLHLLKILRVARILRIGVLVVQLQQLSDIETISATTVRMVGLILSVVVLTVTAASVVQVAETIPFHSAFYFVTTTLTTVGLGDITPQSFMGRVTVMAMIAVGAVTIPVQVNPLPEI